MDSMVQKLKAILGKLKGNKRAEMIVAAVVVVLVVAIYFGTSGIFDKKSTSTTTVTQTVEQEDAVEKWERRLSAVLSEMDGVGKADVMITVVGTTEKVTANTVTTNVTSSQNAQNTTNSTNTTTSPVLVNGGGKSEPYIIKEIMPEIVGVIVVAKGAENNVTKLAILRAVQTALKVSADRIEIYPMK